MKRSRFAFSAVPVLVFLQFFLAYPGGFLVADARELPADWFMDEIAPEAGGQDKATGSGILIRLSEGVGENAGTPGAPVALAPATPLSDAATREILQRIKPLKVEPRDKKEFSLRDSTPPPPTAGKKISGAFPAAKAIHAPEVSPSSALEVVRYSPEGEVNLISQLSATFSQPMVALTSQEDATAQIQPVKLTPQPPGAWRWVGTKTIVFEPADRFPMATEYKVEIPAGTKSAVGGILATGKSWIFRTPAAGVKEIYPGPASIPQLCDPLMFVSFDQKIDPEAAVQAIRVIHQDKTEWKVKLAGKGEVDADPIVSRLAREAQEKTWLAFRIADRSHPLSQDSSLILSIGEGVPSAEGPLRTTKAQTAAFRTFGKLRTTGQKCNWGNCCPSASWTIAFNNPVDEDRFDPGKVLVEPGIPGMKAELAGGSLSISGIKKANMEYKVTLKNAVWDRFGQTLDRDATISFQVGSSPAAIFSPDSGFQVFDPYAEPVYPVYSVNHDSLKVRLHSVGPEDWPGFQSVVDHTETSIPGKLILSETVKVNARPEELAETRIDLRPALREGLGQVLVVVEPGTSQVGGSRLQRVAAWVQVTGIGLDVFQGRKETLIRATALKDGKPLDGVEVKEFNSGTTSRTGTDGLATLPYGSERGQQNSPWLLVASKGPDSAMLPGVIDRYIARLSARAARTSSPGRGHTSRSSRVNSRFINLGEDVFDWFVFDDRGLYRPGEEVHVKGFVRRICGGPKGDVGFVGGSVKSVSYRLRDFDGDEVLKGLCRINPFGGFDLAFSLPPGMNLGDAYLDFRAEGTTGKTPEVFTHSFQVEEFRRPEFEVGVSTAKSLHFAGESTELTAKASYYAGGALPDARVEWTAATSPVAFSPPNRQDFAFGKRVSWLSLDSPSVKSHVDSHTGKTDATGKHRLRMDFSQADFPSPVRVQAEASITDVNSQTWSASTTLLVHPASIYVGLKSPRTFLEKGRPLIVQSIVTDLDGNAVEGRDIELRVVRLDQTWKKGKWRESEVDHQECRVRSAADPIERRFEAKEGGRYRISASVVDEFKRRNLTELEVWVSGGKLIPRRDVAREEVTIVPDRKEYQPGDTAELLIQAPFSPAEGLMTLRRGGLVRAEPFVMTEPSCILKVPVEDGFIPNLNVRIDMAGAATRVDDAGQPDESLPKRPAYASGSVTLSIPPVSRTLSVKLAPRTGILEPGGKTTVDVEVKDASGRPVSGGEVALVVADEAVLDLTGYRIDDPVDIFYPERVDWISESASRGCVMLANPSSFSGAGKGIVDARALDYWTRFPGGEVSYRRWLEAMIDRREAMFAKHMKMGDGPPQIRMRENFNPLALFLPSLKTDADGRTRVEVTLPDNLTRYRITAVAVSGEKCFGIGESAVTARLPVMVRPSAPRFLNFGDCFDLPAVVQNQTDALVEVDVVLRTANLELTEGAGRHITVPANDRVEVRFPASTSMPGTARFQLAAVSGKWADAAEGSLPVYTPATTEAFAVYGEIDKGMVVQPVQAPPGVVRQFGGLEIETSSTQLQALTDALIRLTSYPFECSEQLASRMLAVAALRDVLGAFKAEGLPKPEETVRAVERDIDRLRNRQNPMDGGFGFWSSEESFPYVSIHVAHALQRVKNKGFKVPEDMLENAGWYLEKIEERIPARYGAVTRRPLIAYSLYVRNLMGSKDLERARSLVAESGSDGLSTEAVGWLLSVLTGDPGSIREVESLRRRIADRVSEEAGTAQFVTSRDENDHLLLRSARRADAVVLEALIADRSGNDLVPKIVRGLLAHRKLGHWENTQEDAFVLLALEKYFAACEKTMPNFRARAWLGRGFAGAHSFKGRTTDRFRVQVPMAFLADQTGPRNLILQKEGAGRLYYRLGLRYAPQDLRLAPADRGFAVQRTYEPVDAGEDVQRAADGTWLLRSGARVRVRLTMAAPARRYHVALVDHLPAGLEALNPALSITPSLPEEEDGKDGVAKGSYCRFLPWFEHQNLRDDRAEAFSFLLEDGAYSYSYITRATTRGSFVAPPATVEEMYHPETFGRGGTDRVVVR